MPSFVEPVLAPGSLSLRAQPVLTSDELVLRPWARTDAPAVARAYADADIQRWHARWLTADEALEWVTSWSRRWSDETGAGWAITHQGHLVGRIDLRTLNLADGVAEVGYWVVPEARGQAIAPRALRAVSTWSFDDLGLHRLELAHSTENAASCRVAEKVGYALEGTKRSQGLHADGWHDMHLHALVNDAQATARTRREVR